MLGNDGNVGGNDGLGAFRDELEALVLARRVLQEAFFFVEATYTRSGKSLVCSELAILNILPACIYKSVCTDLFFLIISTR